MLHVIRPDAHHRPENNLQDVFAHRLDFVRSEGLEVPLEGRGCDAFDTESTTYLVYRHPSYGLVGSARLLPKEDVPAELGAALTDKTPFILADCLFHLPKKTGFFEASDSIVRSRFSHLLEAFYTSLMTYLEKRALQDRLPLIPFYLSEEDYEFISFYSKWDSVLLKEIQPSPDFESAYLGVLDFSEMLWKRELPQFAPVQTGTQSFTYV